MAKCNELHTFGGFLRSSQVAVGLVSASLVCSALLLGCGGSAPPASPSAPNQLEASPSTSSTAPVVVPEVFSEEVFVGAGDIAKCGKGDAEATAKLLDRVPGTVFTLGDNVQDQGTAEEYE